MEINEEKICERFKEVRTSLKMKQGDFAKEIRTTQGHVSDIENKRKNVSDRVIEIICLKYGISEKWIRTGEGKMKIEDCQEERYSINIGKLQRADNETIMRWVNAIAETKPEVLIEIEKFMKKILEIEDEPE